MSYVDTVDHSYVGNMFGIPVYHPLGEYNDEYVADQKNFLIGGGSGEHPAMIVNNLDGCVLDYVGFCYDNALERDENADPEPDWVYDFRCPIFTMHEHDILDFSSWNMESIAAFAMSAKDLFEKTDDVLYKPRNIERMISIMLGEFVFYSAQRLLSPIIIDHVTDFDQLRFKKNMFYGYFRPIVVTPKGYPVSGRNRKLGVGLRFDEEELYGYVK